MRRSGAAAMIARSSERMRSSALSANPRSRIGASAGAWGVSKRSGIGLRRSFRIMEDHAQGMPAAGPQPAHAMPHVYTIGAARPLHRSVMHGENDSIALPKRHDFGARLHARPLFGEHELAAREVPARFRQQDRHLQRERQLAIEILVQAVDRKSTR